MYADAPIGVFDSGVGGLSVLHAIRQKLPQEQLLYVADSGHVPYGEKSPEFIQTRSLAIARFLHQQGAKALVVACNTATAAAVQSLRAYFPHWLIVGMEPAIKPAVAVTCSGVIGVLATTGTLHSSQFAALLDRFAGHIRVVTQPCPGLVECVEAGALDAVHTRALLSSFVQPLLEQGCDTLILGCTHYPFLRPLLAQLVPPHIAIVDTGAAVARRLAELLQAKQLCCSERPGADEFWTSGNTRRLEAVLPILWGNTTIIQELPC